MLMERGFAASACARFADGRFSVGEEVAGADG